MKADQAPVHICVQKRYLLHETDTRVDPNAPGAKLHVFLYRRMIRHGLHADLSQDTQAVPRQMLLPPVLEPRARALPEAQPAGLQRVAEEALVCRHHRGDVVEHGDGLDDLLRGLERFVLKVSLVEFWGEVWSFRETITVVSLYKI